MKSFPAADFTRNTGDLLDAASREPVKITKHRKARFVLMSVDMYEKLTEDASRQQAVSVADMPDDLGALLDEGISDHLNDG